MTETERIANLFEQSLDGKPYYGPSVVEAMKDITAEVAATKPRRSTHCIWELVAHLTAELQYARALLQEMAGPWIEGESTWPAIPNTSAVAWRQAVEELKEANRALVQVVRQLDNAALDKHLIRVRCSYYAMLYGTIQHNTYHAAQISLLKVEMTAPL